ncbi:MAG TPA: helix-turn-helix domain-containing protein [Catenuloplanes sp.]|jgi:AraC-like DNA-binding protein
MATEPTSEFVRSRPAAPLRPFVAWYGGYRETGGAPGSHRGLPSPHLTLIITLDDPLVMAAHPDPRTPPGRYDTLLGGLHTAPAFIRHDGRQSGVQVALSPLGARALLGLPAGELASTDVDAGEVWGPFARELRDRVLAADGWQQRFTVLDGLLLRRIDADVCLAPEVVRAWRRVVGSAGGVPVSAIAREVGWSGRYLSRRFAVEIGLTPKAAARVARFDRARRLLQRAAGTGGNPGLATLAATCGYYDQAHLAREFGAFAGCSPSGWLAEEFRNIQAFTGAPLPGSVA